MSDEKPPQVGTLTRYERKAVIWTLLMLLLFFWDTVLDVALHALHVTLEYLELALETLIEELFHVDTHAAQMYTAWTGLLALTALGVGFYFWARNMIREKFRSRAYFRSWLKIHFQENWLPISLVTLLWFSWNFLL